MTAKKATRRGPLGFWVRAAASRARACTWLMTHRRSTSDVVLGALHLRSDARGAARRQQQAVRDDHRADGEQPVSRKAALRSGLASSQTNALADDSGDDNGDNHWQP